jgi:predicted AAA+ superfamily ATPase
MNSDMEEIKRFLKIKLPPGQSAFLWGARKTGKSTYLKSSFPDSLYYDFLKTDLFLDLSKRPSLLREQILAQEKKILKQPIILDEVQKVPQILDEVHWLIENKRLSFILCGSSARKLKREKVNLLGGRAWKYEMFPLVSVEINNIDLLRALNQGLIPEHYLQNKYQRSLKAYVEDYLREEVFAEGLIRNIPAFSRFFEALGYSHGELINYSNISRDCGIDSKTVKEYFQILVDTLLGKHILPFKKKQGRQVISKAPKFYLFDVGIAGKLTNRNLTEEKGELFGKAFEHFVLMEIMAYNSLKEIHFEINYWRTKSGLEVDFILGNGEIAIEVKGSSRIDSSELKPIKAFIEEYKPRKAIVVCNEKSKRIVKDITIIPWKEFLIELWNGKLIT